MADIVGLRFVTTGEKEAIQAYERYKRGLLDLDQVQNKYVAAFNRRAREERAALEATARAAARAAREQAQAAARAAQEQARAAAAYKQLAGSMDPAVAAANRLASAQKTLQTAFEQGIISAQKKAAMLRQLNAQYRADELNRYAAAQRKVSDTIIQGDAVVKRLSGDMQLLTERLKQGTVTQQQHDTALKALARQLAINNNYVKANGQLNVQKAMAELRAMEATRAAAAADAAAAATKARLTQSYNQLLASINPVIARQQQTRQTVDMLRAAVAAGAITTTQAAQALNQYRNALRAMDAANQLATRGMNRTGVVAQQMGYQFGDFFVQIQSGTHVMVALGQQATQLIGTFAMLARSTRAIMALSALGVVVPIVTAVAGGIMRASGASDTLKDKVQKLTEGFNDLNESLRVLDDSNLEETFGSFSSSVESLSENMVALNTAASLDNLVATIDKIEAAATSTWFQRFIDFYRTGAENVGASLPFVGDLLGLESRELSVSNLNEDLYDRLGFKALPRRMFLDITGELGQLARSGDMQGVLRQFDVLVEAATLGGAAVDDITVSGVALLNQIRASAVQTAELYAELDGSAQAARDAAEAEKRRAEALRAGADAYAAHVAAYQEEQVAAAEYVAERQAALLEENTRFEEEQAKKRAIAQAEGDAARTAAIKLYYDNREQAAAEAERVEAARAAIRNQRAEEEAALQKAMAQQVADQQAALLEENARYERATQAQVENFNAQNQSLQDQLNLTRTIAQFGQDSAEVRALQLEQEIAARKRSIDAQVAENRLSADHGNLIKALVEELLRAEAAANATADEVAGIAPGLQAAIDQANAFADAMGRARAESAGIGISTAGLQAQAAALEGGASRAEATATAAATTLREKLFAEFPTQGIGPTGATAAVQEVEQQVAERYDAVLQRELAQERVRALTAATGGGTSGTSAGAAAAQDDYLQNLLLEAEQKRRLVGLTEEETRRQEILFELTKRELPLNDERIEQIIQAEAETRKLMEAEQQRQQLMDTVENHIQSAFMAMVDGSSSVEDAFRNMLRNIILAIYEQKVAQPAAEAIGSLIETGISALFKADGGAFNKGVEFYANGGVVNAPTGFRHSGGLGVMGEAGPEAIMPLKRGKDGKLGVQAEGGGAVVVNNYFNMSANGDESVKRIIRGEMPRITEATKAAVVDAKRRGGSYGRSF